jgi:hypothetical protein
METILLAVTAVSLLVALIMSVAAWRMSREERARAGARVAALASASARPEFDASYGETTPAPVAQAPVAVIDELPLRPVLRVVEPTASASARPEIQASYGETSPERSTIQSREGGPSAPSEAVAPAGFLSGGEASAAQSGGRQRGLMAAAAVLFVVLGTGAYWLISGDARASNNVSASAAATNSPLELISLRHERVGSKLSLSGLVRNPSAGAAVEGLNAVVFLFDAQGGFISSSRAGVDFKRLAAGDESPFVITMDAPSNVARYRVSFRTDAGVVAHVDRRSEQPVATAIVR